MLRNVTALLALVFLFAGSVSAQDVVTIKQINEIPQDQIDQLNSLGDSVSSADYEDCGSLIYNSLCGSVVKVTAVVMSDPLNSGLSGLNSEGRPSRIHVFVRDVAADTDGPEYMGLQIVDGGNLGFSGLVVGDVVEITGTVAPYNSTMQMSPTEAPVVVDSRDPATDPIFDPIVVTTADLNADAGADGAPPDGHEEGRAVLLLVFPLAPAALREVGVHELREARGGEGAGTFVHRELLHGLGPEGKAQKQ